MPIEVKTLSRVLVDGIEAGDVVSVLSNYGKRKKETLEALKAWDAAKDAAHATALSDLRTANEATCKEMQACIDALGTTEQGIKLAREIERAKLEAEADELAAKAEAARQRAKALATEAEVVK